MRTTLDNTLGLPTKDRGPDGKDQRAWKGKGRSEIQPKKCPHLYGWVMEKWREGPIKGPKEFLAFTVAPPTVQEKDHLLKKTQGKCLFFFNIANLI